MFAHQCCTMVQAIYLRVSQLDLPFISNKAITLVLKDSLFEIAIAIGVCMILNRVLISCSVTGDKRYPVVP